MPANFVYSNDSKIDSILLHVEDYTDGVSKLRNQPIEKLIEHLEKSNDDLEKSKISNALCWIYFNSDPPKAMKYAKLQGTFVENLDNDLAKINYYDNLAYLYQGFSNYEKSISFMLQALKAKESINDTSGISVSLSGLAGTYYYMRNHKLALKYFTQVYEIEKKAGREMQEASTLGDMGLCYVALGNVEKGLESYFEAVDLLIKNEVEQKAGTHYSNIGIVYQTKGEHDKALMYFKKAAKLKEDEGDVAMLASIYSNISEIYSVKNDFTNALIYGKKAVKNANLSEDKKSILNSNQSLAMAFYSNRNYQLAYEHFKIAFNLKDSIYNETSSEQIAEMQTKYDTEKKEAENSLLLAEKELDKVELEKKSNQQKMLLLGLALAFLIVVYVAYSLNQKKKTNKLLNAQNEEISTKNDIIEEKNKDITDSINYAQRIQDAILPEESILKQHHESFIYYRPKDIVSGDFYWIKETENKLFFSVVDCTGHGVPGAFMSIIGSNSLNKIVEDLKIETTGEILDELNKLVNKALGREQISDDEVLSIRDGMDISICSINKSDATLEYSGANNSLYILRKPQNRIDGLEFILEDENAIFYEVKPNKMAIGGGRNKEKYQSHRFQLNESDTVYLFSDGYADQFGGEKGKKFMYKRFKKMFLSIQNQTMDKQLIHLTETMENWKGDIDQLDDICVMGVRL